MKNLSISVITNSFARFHHLFYLVLKPPILLAIISSIAATGVFADVSLIKRFSSDFYNVSGCSLKLGFEHTLPSFHCFRKLFDPSQRM